MIFSRFRSAGTIIFKLALILFVAGCSKNDSPTPVQAPTSCRLKSISNPTLTYTITRNSKGLPIQLDYVQLSNSAKTTCIIEYDGSDHITKMTEGQAYFTYAYDGNGNVKFGLIYGWSAGTSSYYKLDSITYHYNNDGRIDSAYHTNSVEYYRFEYDAYGNLFKTYQKTPGKSESLLQENLAFDANKNPFIDVNFVQYVFVVIPPATVTGLNLPLVSTHNVLTKNITLYGGSILPVTYTYDYNTLGYPLYCHETDSYFTYECF